MVYKAPPLGPALQILTLALQTVASSKSFKFLKLGILIWKIQVIKHTLWSCWKA